MDRPLPGLDVPIAGGLLTTQTWYEYFQSWIRGRVTLKADTSYYIRSDGNDTNAGLANTASGAFLTWARAVEVINSIDFGNKTVTLVNGNGATYTQGPVLSSAWTGGGGLTIDFGGGGISAGLGVSLLKFSLPGTITIQNGTLAGVTGISHAAIGNVLLGPNLTFGACSNYHMQATKPGSHIEGTGGSYNISGGAVSHMIAYSNSRIDMPLVTATFTANAAFTDFARATLGGIIAAGAGTYPVGAFTVTGRRYNADLGGIIDPNGSGVSAPGSLPNYFPGNAAGVGTNFGVSPWGLYNG